MTFRNSILALLLVIMSSLSLLSCSDDPNIFRVDYSAAPDPIDLNGVIPDTLANGILMYQIEEGREGFGPVNSRDIVYMRFTIWRDNGRGNIRDSSYRNQNEEYILVDVELSPATINTGNYFPKMVSGLKERSFHAAIVPPALTGLPDSIRYDIDIDRVYERIEF